MPKIKPTLTLAAVAIVALAVWAGAQVESTGGTMATAAGRFLSALDDTQREKVRFDFDSPERKNWHFIPRDRKGLPIKEMTPAQRALAFGLIGAGTSREGDLKATTIMSLEAVLLDMEKGSGPLRDPERYFLSIFGEPSNKGTWGWRVEGHHLSLNFTLKDGHVVSATPAFFGANPAEVRQGPRQGLRALAEVEDRALRLLQALDEDQTKAAVVSETAPGDVPSNEGGSAENGLPARAPELGDAGLLASQLNPDQKKMLDALIVAHAENMPEDVARAWLGEVQNSGDDLRFAWYGAADRTQAHAYNIWGPGFDIEFNNTQNGANHVHSVWRNVLSDFGTAGK